MSNVAILIDAENIDPLFAPQIFERAEALGAVVVREIYGAGIALSEWSTPILQHAIHMNMTLKPNRFKNSSDIALVIGAMELLAARMLSERVPSEKPDTLVDTVIIASSDSDFSLLSVRLRTAGFQVIGMGDEKKTNPAWPAACTQFIPLVLSEEKESGKPALPVSLEQPEQRNSSAKETVSEQKIPVKPESESNNRLSGHAPSHAERVVHIREFLSGQLAENNGRLQASSLFHALNKFPDYRFDQQRSRRNPLDYLSRQYPDIIRIEKGEQGAIWVYSTVSEPIEPSMREERSNSLTSENAPVKTSEKSGIQEESKEAAFYAAAGIREDIALQIAKVFMDSPNLFMVFNKLRSEFGAAEGRRYYQLGKEYRNS